MKKRTIIAILSAIAIMFSLAGCDKPAESSDTITIGGLAPLTGNVAVYGISVQNGALLALEEINENGGILGKTLAINFLDEKGDPVEAVNAYNKLISENVVAILGDVTSKPTAAVAELAAKEGIPMLSATATAEAITTYGDNIFRTCFIDPVQGKTMAKFAADSLGATTAAMLVNSSDEYSTGIAQAFKAAAADFGIEIVAEEAYGASDKDFKAQLNNINAKNPDVILVPDYYMVDTLIATQAREIGYTNPILGADGWDGVMEVTDESNYAALNDVYFSNHYSVHDTDPKVANFVNAFSEKYNDMPTSFAALGYDSVYILVEAIEAAGTTDRASVVKALSEINYSGVAGDLHYEGSGDPVKTVTIVRVVDGEYTAYEKIEG